MTGGLLDAPDLARLLSRDRATIWRWTASGIIPAEAVVRFGRVARYKRPVLEAAGFLKPETTMDAGPEPIGCPS